MKRWKKPDQADSDTGGADARASAPPAFSEPESAAPRGKKQRSPLDIAMGLLGRREHSALELRRKLAQRGVEAADIDRVLADLQQRGWQSDTRYAEALVRQKLARGQGPLKLQQSLAKAGLAKTLIGSDPDQQTDWLESACQRLQQWLRSHPAKAEEPVAAHRVRALRHLLSRGFTPAQATQAWRRVSAQPSESAFFTESET